MEIVAVPSKLPGGLEARVSGHFGKCEAFTLVEVANGKPVSVAVVPNVGHGDCAEPVKLLIARGVTRVVAAGMGRTPLAALQAADIAISAVPAASAVGEAISAVLAGDDRPFDDVCTCGGH